MKVNRLYDRNTDLPIYLRMQGDWTNTAEGLASMPIGFEKRLLPLGALAQISIQEKTPSIYREDQQTLNLLEGKLKKEEKAEAKERSARAEAAVEKYRAKLAALAPDLRKDNPVLMIAEADEELRVALDQLKWAVLISVGLIFLVMVFQLGEIVPSLLVLVAIPFGIIGVILSLWIFGSTLSLNSGLGTILLNGIAVANSIILVDFIRRQYARGMNPLEATVSASTARLRPILMTSLTTVLGMLPIALGRGEGGKTLQPLGIAVCGGLWVSALLTLYFVPSLQFQYLRWRASRRARQPAMENSLGVQT